MRALLLALLAFAAAAGCLGHRPEPGPPASDAPSTAPIAEWLELSGNETMTITKVNASAGYTDGGNCVTYAREDVRLVKDGWFNASWTPTSGLHERLRIVAGDPIAGESTAAGPSPLHIEFHDLAVETRLHMFVTTDSEPGAIYRQPVTLDWHLVYEGTPDPPRPMSAACG